MTRLHVDKKEGARADTERDGQLLGLHFVRTGLLDPDNGRLFARLQKYRIEADYSTGFVVTREAAAEDLSACEEFIQRVRRLTERRFPPS